MFTVTDDRSKAHGEDAYGSLGDRYIQIAEAKAGSPIRAALQTARESYDPEIQHLAAIHENMPEDPAAMKARATKLRKLADKGGKGKAGESPATLRARADRLEKMAKETPTTEALKAGGLRVGDELSHGGQKYRVAEDESGMRVLRGHEYGESTPVDALTHVPHDKGSFKPGRPTKAPKVEKYPEPEPAGAREEIPFSRVFGRLASYAAREILLGNPNHVPAGSPGGGEFAIAGLSLGKAAALAERHGHENAKARIASRPSGWVGEIERLKRVERANAKEARDTNWKPNENQREVLGWIGKTRHGKFSEAADVPMFKQYRASTQALIKRGIVARNEMPDGIHYSVAIKIHDSLSRLRSHSAREIFLSLEDEPRDDHGRWESAGGLFPPTSKFRQTAADLAADAENDLDRIAATRHSARADKGTFATKTISGKGDLTTMPAEYAAQMQRARRYAADRGGTIREQEKGLGGLRSALRAGQYEKTGANVERWSNEQASELANSVGEHRAAAAYHDRMSHGDKPDAHGAAALAHKAAAQALVNAGREKGGGVASKAAREASKRAHAGPELDDFSALLSRVTLKSFAGREIWLSGEWRTLPNGVHVEINPSGAIDKGPEVPDRKAYSVATSGAGTHRVTVAPSEGGGFDVVHEPPGHDLRKPFPATHHNDVNSANSAAHAKAMEIRTRIQPYRQPMMQESIPGHIIAAGGKEYPGTAAPESQVPAKHAKQSAYAFADPAGDAARNVVPQKIETPRGDRYVHTMESTPELEKVADSPEKPDWMTVRNVGGKRMISVWGKTAGDVKDRAGHAMLGKVSDSETVRLAGDTFRNKQVIRDSGFNWDKDKKQWTGPKWKMPPTKGVHRIAIQLGRFEIGDAEILLAMEARVPAGRPGGGEWTSTGSKANSIYEHEHAAAYHRQRSSEAEGDANETSYLDTAEGANRSRKLRNLGEAHKAAENAHRHAASTNSDAASSLARAASLKADRMDAKLHGKRFVGLSFMPRSFAAREVIGAGPERLRSFASRHILLDRAEAKGPPDYYRTIDSKIVPFWGTDPNPAESARWEKHRAAEIDKAMAERKARTIHVATKAGDHVIEHDATKVHHTSPEGETATEHHNTQGDARRAAAAKAAHIEAEAHKAGSHLKTETAIPIDEETAAGIKAGHLTVPTEGGEIDPHLAEAYSRHAAKQGYKVGEWKVNKDTGEATATVTKASAKPATVPAERMSESDIKQARESFAERAGWKPRSQAAKAAAKSEMDEINERLDRMAQELNAKAEAKDAAARASKAAARATGNPEPAKPAGAAGEKPVQSTPDKETNAKPDDRAGSGGVGEGRAEDRGRVAGKVEPSGDQGTVEGGQDSRQPADNKAPERVPAEIGRVNQKIDRLTKFLRGKGDHERAELLEQIRAHVNNVGVKSALESLGEDKGTGTVAQYEGAKDLGEFGDFARNYLNRNGIQITGYEGRDGTATATPRIKGAGPVVSTEPKSETGVGGVKKGDTFIKHPTLKNKLEEAQHLPGLEKSEAIPEGVTHLTPEVMKGFDEKFGKGKWVAKPYGDNAAAGTGVLFPQRAEQIQRDAQNTIWDAGSEVAKYGFSLDRNKAGKVIGLVHQNGDKYKFGSEKYNNTINGDVRHWADRAAAAAENEHGAALAGGGKEYMVQPAFNVGASDADRAAGKTILAGEGRVHVVTRNGKAEAVPGATFLKGEKAFNPTPEVFETEHTRAMAKAAEDAINALPASERNGQIYAPDVVKTDQGYKVVEANPANETGKSGPLGNSPYAIDAYVSHMTGQSPAHTRFVRSLLTKGNHDSVSSTGEGSGRGSKGGAASGAAPDAGAGKGGGHAKFKGGVSAAEAKSPEEFARVMESSGVEHKPDEIIEDARDEDQAESDRSHNRQVLNSAKASGAYIPPEKFRSVASGPNVGGWEHDVHHDAASDRYYKFNKGDTFGNFGDVHQYIRNAQQMNKLAPDLDIKVHGVTQGAKGQAQVVTSAARINGSAPSNDEVIAHLRSKGWKPVKGGEYHDGTPYAWRDPESGTKIHDTQGKNWIKTDSGKMVPIDIGITKGKQDPQSLSRFVPRSLAAKGVCGMPRLRSFAARELCPA
nr:hypothetical protein [uncultured Rhodopila sp.]